MSDKPLLLFTVIIFFLGGCTSKKDKNYLFKKLTSDSTGIDFNNNIEENDTLNILNFTYMYNGGGVGIGDLNNDGLSDVIFSGNMTSCQAYVNLGDLKFKNITKETNISTDKWVTGVSIIDINQDGLVDVYLSVAGPESYVDKANLLFINQGNLKFVETASSYGIADSSNTTQSAFFDYDNDGDLDLYLLNHGREKVSPNVIRRKKVNGESYSTDKLYRNNGDLTFTDISNDAGITIEGYGLGVAINDINKDGWQDIYVSNDFIGNDILYINNGDGSFTNKIDSYLKHQTLNGMGNDIGDINNDGLADIMVLDMLPEDNYRQKMMFMSMNYDRFYMSRNMGYETQYMRNTLQLNLGNNHFSEIGQLAGVHNTDWSWSSLFADFDNDGYKDLFISNGYGRDITNLDFVVYKNDNTLFGSSDVKMKKLLDELWKLKEVSIPNYIYKNNGDLTFSNQRDSWGLADLTISNGAAIADLDNDGDLDIITNNINQIASVYRNDIKKSDSSSYLQLVLKGDSLNLNGYGAKITIYHQGSIQYYEHNPYRGYQSTIENIIHFGVGEISLIDSILVVWPNQKKQVLRKVPTNQRLTINYKKAKKEITSIPKEPNTLLKEQDYVIGYTHTENHFIDFKLAPLLPYKHSNLGPFLSSGDINNDGLEDLFIGGAKGKPASIIFQNPSRSFVINHFDIDKNHEDIQSLLFDADLDGDLDLYVVSGGSEFGPTSKNYQDRLYTNDGNGNFLRDVNALPEIKYSGSCVAGSDIDNDGDIDLFVGGRVIPTKYPLAPRSYILINDGGKFTDKTKEICPELMNIGLVTSALWTDFNSDTTPDLIVTGEWMAIEIFSNVSGKLESITEKSGLNSYSGIWNCLAEGDFDQDGDLDYVAGNLGLNSKYKVSSEEPLSIVANDFDKNGSIDPILCHYIQGKNYPAHPRDAVIDQINAIKVRFPKYENYANITFEEMFIEEELKGAYKKAATVLSSSYIENLGNGKFSITPLPIEIQFSPVNGLLVTDINDDENLDIIAIGNSYATEVLSGWYDAGIGNVLLGDGQGNFTNLSPVKSGFFVDSDARHIATIKTPVADMYIVTSNSDSLKVFVK